MHPVVEHSDVDSPPTAGGDAPQPGRAVTRRGMNTEKRLVEAAWEVFSEKPYNETRISEITERAGAWRLRYLWT
jgi:hypothetical protein